MTRQEYDQAFDDILCGKPITQHTADQLRVLASQCGAEFKRLRKTNKAAAYWFKDERANIHTVLSRAQILAEEPATV